MPQNHDGQLTLADLSGEQIRRGLGGRLVDCDIKILRSSQTSFCPNQLSHLTGSSPVNRSFYDTYFCTASLLYFRIENKSLPAPCVRNLLGFYDCAFSWWDRKTPKKVGINLVFLSSSLTQLAVFCFVLPASQGNYQVLLSFERYGTKLCEHEWKVPPTPPDQTWADCSRGCTPCCRRPDVVL